MLVWGMLAVSVVWPLLARLPGKRGALWQAVICRRWCQAVCRILGLRVAVQGVPSANTRLWVANHISWLDIIAVGAQQPVLFIAKAEVADWPVLGYLARRIGVLFVQRGDAAQTARVAERMAWLLRQGRQVLLFPEGTTTNGERVLRFHGKLLQPAQWAQAPAQAIALEYQGEARAVAPFIGEDEFLPHLLRILTLDEIPLRIHYCPPPVSGLSRDGLARQLREQVLEALFCNGHENKPAQGFSKVSRKH
jgi:1-acyl-sn-glycerol-3-phosphate acyltransferase